MDTDVVVVGAGPTGLALACGLRAAGLAVRVLDKATGPCSDVSGARPAATGCRGSGPARRAWRRARSRSADQRASRSTSTAVSWRSFPVGEPTTPWRSPWPADIAGRYRGCPPRPADRPRRIRRVGQARHRNCRRRRRRDGATRRHRKSPPAGWWARTARTAWCARRSASDFPACRSSSGSCSPMCTPISTGHASGAVMWLRGRHRARRLPAARSRPCGE